MKLSYDKFEFLQPNAFQWHYAVQRCREARLIIHIGQMHAIFLLVHLPKGLLPHSLYDLCIQPKTNPFPEGSKQISVEIIDYSDE